MSTLQRMQILVTPEQKRWLEAESQRRDEPVAALVREAIESARTCKSPRQRLEAMVAMEHIWSSPGDRVTTLPIEDLNRMIDDSRMGEAMGAVGT